MERWVALRCYFAAGPARSAIRIRCWMRVHTGEALTSSERFKGP